MNAGRLVVVLLVVTFSWCNLSMAGADEAASKQALAERGVKFLETYCQRCHGVDFRHPGLDVKDRATLLRPKDKEEAPFVVPGQPEQSRLWQVVVKHDPQQMPPEKQKQPTDADQQLLRDWIAAGFEFPVSQRPARPYLGEESILAAIAKDLDQQPQTQRRFLRYFSLWHLWNDPAVSDEQLRLTRAAVSKLINSLSRQKRIVVPRLVDGDSAFNRNASGVREGDGVRERDGVNPTNPAHAAGVGVKQGLVMAIDLRDYGWTERQWLLLLEPQPDQKYAGYPYGLQRGDEAAQKVYERTHCQLPYVRADWFVRNAARPPLYHDLLGLPTTSESFLLARGVNVLKRFDEDRLWRAGLTGEKSGVSDHNRIVERFDSDQGYLWNSYDSGGDDERANFFNFPLGPVFPGRKQPGAFLHDGGELIASLPNGLQEYLLAKSNGERINAGPQTIVKDPNEFAGGFDIVNGISCMGCHKHGIVTFEDAIRPLYSQRSGQAIADKVLRLYPQKVVMDKFVADDTRHFLEALDKATGVFLRTSPDDQRPITAFPEPITQVAKIYDRVVGLAAVARELGLPDKPEDAASRGIPHAAEFATVIKLSDNMKRLNLAPLATGQTLPRELWEKAFQRTARELKLGLPISF